jgi:predicted regulator of Ras-like GTPase activity (Roadblock/LC7/MglB family)
MSFKEILRETVAGSTGGVGALLMAYDGIAVDEYRLEAVPLDLQALSVEYASLFKGINQTVASLKTGAVEEVTVLSGLSRVVMRKVDDEYFVVLVLEKDGNLGKGRYLLQRAAFRIREELA